MDATGYGHVKCFNYFESRIDCLSDREHYRRKSVDGLSE